MILSSSFKDDFSSFLNSGAFYIALAVVICIIATVILFVILNHKEKETPKMENKVSSNDWLIALGNKENIVEVSAKGSRLSLTLVDKEKLDIEKLKSLGVSNIISMKDKQILVINNANEIVELLK